MFPVYIIQTFCREKAQKKLIGLEKIYNKGYLKYPPMQLDLFHLEFKRMDLSVELNSQDGLEMASGRAFFSCLLWESCFTLLGESRDISHHNYFI